MSRPTVRRRSIAVVLLGAAVAAAAACGGTDPFAPQASYENTTVLYQVYPLSTAPTQLPTAISLFGFQSVRPAVRSNLSLNFDLALDVDASGRVRLLPPKLVVAPQAGSLATGIQIVSNSTFETLTRAPNGGYDYDSATVVRPGQVVAIQTQGAGAVSVACATTTPMYASVVIDSVKPTAGTQLIYLRARVDRNCGFRSLESGIPTS
jgi:hypothetical protein